MVPAALLGASLAGAAYTLTPGPGFLALLGIGAAQGRGAGARFIFGHIAGDALWSGLALAAIIGAREVGTAIFDVLGVVCGLYLGWLGLSALRARRSGEGGPVMIVARPLLRGLIFGLTNPKGYPVAVATFTALLAGYAETLQWSSLPGLLGAALCGSLLGDCLLVAIIGAPRVRRFYRRHEVWIVRASGLMFLGFAAAALQSSVPGLMRLRR